MYARVTTATGATEQLDEGLQKFRNEMLPLMEAMAGFKGLYSLVDRSTGKSLVISLWETQAAMQASSTAVTPLRAQAVRDVGGSGESVVETYEVAIQPGEDEGQRLASAVAQAARDLEGHVRRLAASDEVAKVRRQVEASLKSFEEWARRRGGPPPPQ